MSNKNDTGKQKTRALSESTQKILAERKEQLPIWIRAPKTGQEFYTGLTRAKLYELAGLGRIKSRSIREPGQVKGTRVFLLQSILDHIEGCCDSTHQIAA